MNKVRVNIIDFFVFIGMMLVVHFEFSGFLQREGTAIGLFIAGLCILGRNAYIFPRGKYKKSRKKIELIFFIFLFFYCTALIYREML